jgi:uncharacterized protein
MFNREDERAELGRLLGLGQSIQMLAARRVGKTWLMQHVAEDHRTKGWLIAFVDVEGMHSEDEFLRELCRKIEEAGTVSARVFAHLTQRLKQLSMGGWGENPINAIGSIDAKGFAEALIASLNDQDRDTLILVDEIALFVMTRLSQDARTTLEFLYHLRKLRQEYPRVRWLLSGSIGLDAVARRAQLLGALVDLEIFPLEPFTRPVARAFLEDRCLNGVVRWPFALDDSAFAHLAQELGWLAPFYLKLIADRIKPTGKPAKDGLPLATVADIDRAFDQLLRPEYRINFATWEEHIDKNFLKEEVDLMHRILEICCEQAAGETFATIQTRLAEKFTVPGIRLINNMLTVLANDGFLHLTDQRWKFRSGLLRRYWLRYLHE